MNKISCENCSAACCKGVPLLTMQLALAELDFMKKSGNVFQTVADPVSHDREEVIYPAGMQLTPNGRSFNWLAEKGREYEPLPANFGRYALVGACKYLETDENGWEHCGVYEERPQVCRDFEMSSQKCVTIRTIHGVVTPTE